MPRPLRIIFEGATYHAFSRSNRGELILAGDEEKEHFLRRLYEGAVRYEVDVYAYCLMGTHYHLLFQTRKANLPNFMHFVLSSYGSYLSSKGWTGHVFKGRYNAICINAEEYLLVASKYIHMNPVEAAMVHNPAQYAWSSYPFYIGEVEPPGWLKTEIILDYFGPDKNEAKNRYRDFIENDMDKPFPYPYERVVARAILGNETFIKEVLRRCRNNLYVKEAVAQKELLRRTTVEDVFRTVCERYDLADLRKSSSNYSKTMRHARQLFMFLARKYTSAPNRRIAELVGDIAPPAVSANVRKTIARMECDATFREGFESEASAVIQAIESAS